MGRKQTRTRKYIYFCIASLIFLSLSGCAELEKNIKRRLLDTSRQHLIRKTQELINKGDYEGAIKENENVLSSQDSKNKDLALFNKGVIYAHAENPKKNYGNSLDSLRLLMKDYPKSPLFEQAKVLTEILPAYEKLNVKLNQNIQEIEKLNQMIEKSKQVDIEIEEKKREKGQ